jgi:hypothetical protein
VERFLEDPSILVLFGQTGPKNMAGKERNLKFGKELISIKWGQASFFTPSTSLYEDDTERLP